jgi:Fe-S-cluster containining protein
MSGSDKDNPCQRCGACCAAFRVSFYSGEVDDMPGGTVPAGLVEQIGPSRACMLGTAAAPVRCRALHGEIGREVSCAIYEFRPSPCREFAPFAVLGTADERCTEARRKYGLAPLG